MGTVFVPEDNAAAPSFDYTRQIDWEEQALHRSDAIVFWVPRDLETMPAFTTNIEWGVWCSSGKVVLGAPDGAPKLAYMRHYARKYQVPFSTTLRATLAAAVDSLGSGDLRRGDASAIPVAVWQDRGFQQWYRAQLDAGNRLADLRVRWQFLFSALTAAILLGFFTPRSYVSAERRHKRGEIIITRPDIAAVLAYHRGPTLGQTQVVLVREFRSSAATKDGMVHELPGGSSFCQMTPIEVAASELREETGLGFSIDRFVTHEARQCLATMLTHRGDLFSIELNDTEIAEFVRHEGREFGANDSERTFVEVRSVKEILGSDDVDWTHIGMILSVLSPT